VFASRNFQHRRCCGCGRICVIAPCVVMEGEPPLQQVCSLTRRARALGLACRHDEGGDRDVFGISPCWHARPSKRKRQRRCCSSVRRILSANRRVQRRRAYSLCAIDIAGTEKFILDPRRYWRATFLPVSVRWHHGLHCHQPQLSCRSSNCKRAHGTQPGPNNSGRRGKMMRWHRCRLLF